MARRPMVMRPSRIILNITKRSISAGEMYLTIYVEWADDHFGLGLA